MQFWSPVARRARRSVRLSRGSVAACVAIAIGTPVVLIGVVAGEDEATTAQAAAGAETVRAVQRALGVGADGVIGPQTEAAIRGFQQREGLPVTGVPNEATLAALGLGPEFGLSRAENVVVSASLDALQAPEAVIPRASLREVEGGRDLPAPADKDGQDDDQPKPSTEALDSPDSAPQEASQRGPRVVGGALAGDPPPPVGGQLAGAGGLHPVPPGRSPAASEERHPARTAPVLEPPGGLSDLPPSTTPNASPDLQARLERIARCESGGDPRAISPDGRYRGKYQFLPATWRSVGGRGDPAAASAAEQDRRAAALYRREGARPWPVCGRR